MLLVNQEITPKKFLGWDPAYNKQYPFETWVKDMYHWQVSTDMAEQQRGSIVVLRLGGSAREFANDLRMEDVRDGGQYDMDGQMIVLSGVNHLIWQVCRHLNHLNIEEQMQTQGDDAA